MPDGIIAEQQKKDISQQPPVFRSVKTHVVTQTDRAEHLTLHLQLNTTACNINLKEELTDSHIQGTTNESVSQSVQRGFG